MAKNKEIVLEGKLDEIIVTQQPRKNGRIRIQQDFQFCPSKTEQHSAKETDLNYLVQRFKPDELAAYIMARNANRQPINNHDFSAEPSLQEAKNINYRIQQGYATLPDEVRNYFKGPLDFLKFIDNPANKEKMLKMGLLKEREIEKFQETVVPPTTRTQDTKETKSTEKTES